MRTTLIILFTIFLIGRSLGQLVPSSNQAFQLAPAYNPAFTGVDDFASVKLGYRQWVSIPDGPQYINLVVASRLKSPSDLIHNALRLGKPVTRESLPFGKRIIHGFGATIINEEFGVVKNFDVGITYSFQIPLKKNLYLSTGIAPYFSNSKFQLGDIKTLNDDSYLDLLKRQGNSTSEMNLRAGILLYSPRFYAHASYLQVWNKVLDETISDFGYRFVATAGVGVSFNVGQKSLMKPSIQMLFDEQNEIVIDYTAKVYLGEKMWSGITYRSSGFVSFLLGIELNSLLGFSYSYELPTGELKGFSSGSHEILIGLKLANHRNSKPYTW